MMVTGIVSFSQNVFKRIPPKVIKCWHLKFVTKYEANNWMISKPIFVRKNIQACNDQFLHVLDKKDLEDYFFPFSKQRAQIEPYTGLSFYSECVMQTFSFYDSLYTLIFDQLRTAQGQFLLQLGINVSIRSLLLIVLHQNKCFWGYTGISLSVCASVCPSVYKILNSVEALALVLSHIC